MLNELKMNCKKKQLNGFETVVNQVWGNVSLLRNTPSSSRRPEFGSYNKNWEAHNYP